MGRSGAIAPPAGCSHAVNDALRGLGVELSETPLTPRRLLAAIERASQRRNASAAVETIREGNGIRYVRPRDLGEARPRCRATTPCRRSLPADSRSSRCSICDWARRRC